MQSLDLTVLTQAHQWLANKQPTWLCTIVKTLGSSPRPVGSMMSYSQGKVVGTLSGGCVEDDLLARLAAGEFCSQEPALVKYGVSAADNERLGLPCGGRLEILVQTLDETDEIWLNEVVIALAARSILRRDVDRLSGTTTLHPSNTSHLLTLDDHYLQHTLGPKMRMLLVGAGQLAQVLASLAIPMDYDVQVIDPREDMIAQWQGPAVPLLHGFPDDLIRELVPDQHTIIITLTHDPRIDDMALLEALHSDATYVGALGSLRTTAARLERLEMLGLSTQQIARLHAPVGLSIGSKTPWEIAVAIMAELVQHQRTPA